MPTCYDNHLSVQLICSCNSSPIIGSARHDATLDNHKRQALYDVSVVTSILSWTALSRLNVRATGGNASGSAQISCGTLSPHSSAVAGYILTTRGTGRHTETVATSADWTLSASSPITGMPSKRFARGCSYSVPVQ